ncbi:MAG: hypothetical protein OHK005_20560 [Candidatus Methylacidiphilales bacterium]
MDLMLLAPPTFEQLQRDAHRKPIGHVELPVASPLHLIALKLHALKQPQRAADGKDSGDIIELMRSVEMDGQSPAFKAILEKYGDETTRAKLREFIAQKR